MFFVAAALNDNDDDREEKDRKRENVHNLLFFHFHSIFVGDHVHFSPQNVQNALEWD